MKFLFALLLISTAALAEERVILDVSKAEVKKHFDYTDARFNIDLKTNQVNGVLDFVDEWESCSSSGGENPHETCTTHHSIEKSFSAPIHGLTKVDDQLVLNSEASQIVCANLKRGRIFKNTIRIILTGECQLFGRLVKAEEGKRYQLIFKTAE